VTVVVDQRGLEFLPRVQGMAVGDSVIFRNNDREAHNVNSQSGCCAFNVMISPGGEHTPIQPDQVGLIKLLCNIHQQMRGFVMVCPSSLFALTDADGSFLIRNVPDGPQKIIVWQEHSKRFVQEIEIAGQTEVEFHLGAATEFVSSASGHSVNSIVTWNEVQRQISQMLDAAMSAAQRAGGNEGERLVLEAYYRHFEASELETAVRLHRGDERVFELERMFDRLRKPMMADLAAGRTDEQTVRRAKENLLAAIREDIVELDRHGITDRTKISTIGRSVVRASPVAIDSRKVMAELRRAFDVVAALAEAGKSPEAASSLIDSYFQIFHRVEPAIAAQSLSQKRRLEERFMQVRNELSRETTRESVRANLDTLWAEIDLAVASLDQNQDSNGTAAVKSFINAFIILTREGVEALLVVTALLMYLNRLGQPEGKRSIYIGLIVAVVATVATWAALQWVIAQAGLTQELIEGIVALLASAVLFYVSYWLISRSEARHWQEFLTRQIGRGLSTGSKGALALVAFLAVYREGAETILMFQPMLVRPAPRELVGVFLGIAAAVVALIGIFCGLRLASFRLAIRPFFRVTGLLLFVLSVIFAGKGICELQEAGFLSITALPRPVESIITGLPIALRDTLGLGATLQAVAIQCMLVSGAAASFAVFWFASRMSSLGAKSSNIQSTVSEPVA